MNTTPTKNTIQVATATHLSTFAKYLFPFGNFLLPLILWQINNDKPFVDHHGKQALNFQLSILIYSIAVGIICIPFFVIFATDFVSLMEALDHGIGHPGVSEINNLSGYVILFAVAAILLVGLFIFELYAVINASMKASKGEYYKYPFCIPFLNTNETSIEPPVEGPDSETEENISVTK